MKNLIFVWILFLGITLAQDEPDLKKQPPTITYFVKTQNRVSKNMIFLMDCSTSMGRNNRFKTALNEVNTILRQPLDDGMFSLMTFKAREYDMRFWAGVQEEDDPKPAPPGWAKLPSLTAVISANNFLNNVGCDDYTDLGTGIQKAFELNANKEELTLIIFTDGNNTYPHFKGQRPSQVVAHINTLQKIRTDKGKDKILIFILGVSVEQNVVMLSAIAKAGGGGYLTTDAVCDKCRKNETDVPEVQQIHRAHHIPRSHFDYDNDYDDNLRWSEDEPSDNHNHHRPTPPRTD